jgi:tetratricopeptide (TPR) repeat protein
MSDSLEIDEKLKTAILHQQAGRLGQAEALYRQILTIKPDHVDALQLLGVIMILRNRFDVAVELISKAITIVPTAAMFHYNLGLALGSMGKLEDASRCYRRALELEPRHPMAAANLGDALKNLERFAEAEEAYRQALAIDPAQADVQNNLGIALQAQGKLVDAENAYRAALQLNSQMVTAYNNLSRLRRQQNRFDEAIEFATTGLRLSPNLVELRYNLGSALLAAGRAEEAVGELELAAQLRPDHLAAMNELGQALKSCGRYMDAMDAYNRVLSLAPDYTDAHVNKGILLLLLGDLPAGFREYEWRWRWPVFASELSKYAAPLWDGSELAGKTILLHAEQGLGDTIQFARFAKILKNRGAGKVILACQPSLVELMKRVPGVDETMARGEQLPPHDVQCPLMRLPFLLGTTLKTVPGEVPYVPSEPSRDARPGSIGLCWSANANHPEGARKNFPIEKLAPLGALAGATFHSLQVGPAAQELQAVKLPFEVHDETSGIVDFADTAALIADLDVIVSVDTAVCHLAGAMGKPAFTLLSYDADWRWLLKREDSPWYPTMRLIRQRKRGDWDSVIARLVTELQKQREQK